MTAGNQQGNKRKRRGIVFQHWCQQMTLHVMDTQHRHTQSKSQGMGHRTTYHQRSHQTGTGGVGNAVDISANPTGIGKHLITQRQQFANMVARGQLRHHTAVVCMHINLAEQCMRQQPTLAVVEGNAGFITGGFNTENQHK